MATQDLYFLFNPYTGLVKIGVAADVDYRRRTLEYACGVGLEVLAVFEKQGSREVDLHEAFAAQRQRGEWFTPTADLMGVIAGDESIDALLVRCADRIARHRAATIARDEQRKAEQKAERAREHERLAAVRAEEARIKHEEAEKRAAAKRRREEREAAKREAAAAEIERSTDTVVARDRFVDLVGERTNLVRSNQRARNCANVGVKVTAV